MILCLCFNIPESIIKELVMEGYNLEEIQSKLNVGTNCGCCNEELLRLVSELNKDANK